MTGSSLTPEQVQTMVDLLPSVQSLRDLAALMGLPQKTLQDAAKPFIAILRMQGALPPCPCGRPRFHPYGCSAVSAKTFGGGRIPGVATGNLVSVLVKRAEIIDAIMTGEPYADLERRLGMPLKAIRYYLKHLTPEQRARRKELERQRGSLTPLMGGNGRFLGRGIDRRNAGAPRAPRSPSSTSHSERELRL